MFRFYRVTFGLGVLVLIVGIVIGFAWPFIFNFVLKKNLQLSPSSESYKLWNRTPIPMYLEVYLFNWTNSKEFLEDKTLKPEFEEVGPFVFKEVHQRVAVSWSENGSVSYNQTRTWNFVPEESRNLSTPIYNLNVIATTVTQTAARYRVLYPQYSKIIQELLDFFNLLYKEKLIIARPAGQWLFDGIKDKLLDLIRRFEPLSKETVPYDKFGWFYGRNLSSTYDGRFTINTGENIYDLGNMEEWNSVNKTKFFEGECGVVRGTSGELFAPIKSNNDSLTIFVTDFCGPLTLSMTGPKVVEELTGYHYVGNENVFDNGKLNPKNKCFCIDECSPPGVRNISSCRQAPLFISFPHFYLADPSYRASVAGMKPNKSEHEFFLTIDPFSGIPLEVRAQLQLNVLLRPLDDFTMFKNVPKVYIPMMWFRQRAKVTPQLISRAKALRVVEELGLWLTWGLCATGLIVTIVTVAFMKFGSKRTNFEPLVTPEQKPEDTGDDDDSDR